MIIYRTHFLQCSRNLFEYKDLDPPVDAHGEILVHGPLHAKSRCSEYIHFLANSTPIWSISEKVRIYYPAKMLSSKNYSSHTCLPIRVLPT